MSIVTQAIAQADREARFLSAGELKAVSDFFVEGQNRLQIAMVLATQERQIIEKGSQQFWQRCPVTPSNSGNPTYRASCLRDQTWYLRLVSYAIVVGDVAPIEEIGTRGARAMYDSLGVPIQNVVECMRSLKQVALDRLTLDAAAEAAPYFDYLIQGLMS